MEPGASALQGNTQRIGLANLCRVVLDRAGQDVQQVVQHALDHSDEERSQEVLRFVHTTRQRLLRLKALVVKSVLMKHRGASRAVTYVADLAAHAATLHQTAEHLFHSHQHFSTQQPVPLFDVHSALEITAKGVVDLPSFIGDVAPNVQPPKGKREQLVAECNALVLQLIQSVHLPAGLRVLHIENGLVVLMCEGEHEASLLLEPAPPIPLDVVVNSLVALRTAKTGSDRPAAPDAEADSKPSTSAGPIDVTPDDSPGTMAMRDRVRAELLTAGFDEDAFGVRELQWRWRLVNVAVQAGSAGGQSMTLSQLQFLRAELDYRMLHFRLTAVVRHCHRVLAGAPDAEAATSSHIDVAADGRVADAGLMPSGNRAARADEVGADAHGPGGKAATPVMSSSLTHASSMDANVSIDGARTGGSAEACLDETYPSLLAAALSAPVALLHSVLHDVAASLAFRAACASAADLAQSQSSCWREALHCGPRTKQLTRGLRVGFWLSVPLLRARDEAMGAEGAGGTEHSGEVGPTEQLLASSSDAKKVANAATGAAAIEIGTRDGELVVTCDPPLQTLWLAADVASACGAACPQDPVMPLDSGDLNGVLEEVTAHVALAQLALLARHLTRAVSRGQWSWRLLETSLQLDYVRTTNGLQNLADVQPLEPLAGDTGSVGSAAPSRKTIREQIAACAHTARKGPARSDVQQTAVLKLVVRGHIALLMTLESTTGRLCLHAGAAQVQGYAVATALELEEAQQQMQQLQTNALTNIAAGKPQDPGERLLPHLCDALAEFLIGRLLRLRCESRVAFASRLGLSPQPRPPFPDALLASAVQSAPDLAAVLPQKPAYFALGSMPPAPELVALPLAAGTAPWLRTTQPTVSSARWLQSQCFVAVGLAPSPEKAPPSDGAALQNVHLRLCGVLLTCLTDTSGRVRHIGNVDAMPARVFRRAKALYEGGASAAATLAEIGAPSESLATGWWQGQQSSGVSALASEEPYNGGLAGKRARSDNEHGLPANGKDHLAPDGKRLRCDDGSSSSAAQASKATGPCDSEAGWGPADVGHERLQVVCMLAWAQERALAHHLRIELQAAGVVYEEEQMLESGTNARGRLGLGQRSVFALRGLPRRQPESSICIPEGFVPWPRALAGSASCASGEQGLPDAAIKAIQLEVTGSDSWVMRVQAPALCAALQQTQGEAGTPQGEHWRLDEARSDTVVRRYDLQEPGTAPPQCWQHAAELALTKELFVAFALLQRPDVDAQPPPSASTPPAVSFPYPGVTIEVILSRIHHLRIRVRATEGAAEHIGADLERGAVLHEMFIVQHAEHRLLRAPAGASAGMQLRTYQSPLLSTRLPASRAAFGVALTKHVRALELQLFLDAVAHTMVAHRAIAACMPFDGAAASLSRVQTVRCEDTIPPYRLLLVLTAQPVGTSDPKAYACGIQLRAGGVATLHFDLRQEQVPRTIQERFWPQGGEGPRGTAEMPLEIPAHSMLVQQLCSHDPRLAWLPPDPQAVSTVDSAAAGPTVVVRQGHLKRAAGVVARHLDAQLAAPPAA